MKKDELTWRGRSLETLEQGELVGVIRDLLGALIRSQEAGERGLKAWEASQQRRHKVVYRL